MDLVRFFVRSIEDLENMSVKTPACENMDDNSDLEDFTIKGNLSNSFMKFDDFFDIGYNGSNVSKMHRRLCRKFEYSVYFYSEEKHPFVFYKISIKSHPYYISALKDWYSYLVEKFPVDGVNKKLVKELSDYVEMYEHNSQNINSTEYIFKEFLIEEFSLIPLYPDFNGLKPDDADIGSQVNEIFRYVLEREPYDSMNEEIRVKDILPFKYEEEWEFGDDEWVNKFEENWSVHKFDGVYYSYHEGEEKQLVFNEKDFCEKLADIDVVKRLEKKLAGYEDPSPFGGDGVFDNLDVKEDERSLNVVKDEKYYRVLYNQICKIAITRILRCQVYWHLKIFEHLGLVFFKEMKSEYQKLKVEQKKVLEKYVEVVPSESDFINELIKGRHFYDFINEVGELHLPSEIWLPTLKKLDEKESAKLESVFCGEGNNLFKIEEKRSKKTDSQKENIPSTEDVLRKLYQELELIAFDQTKATNIFCETTVDSFVSVLMHKKGMFQFYCSNPVALIVADELRVILGYSVRTLNSKGPDLIFTLEGNAFSKQTFTQAKYTLKKNPLEYTKIEEKIKSIFRAIRR